MSENMRSDSPGAFHILGSWATAQAWYRSHHVFGCAHGSLVDWVLAAGLRDTRVRPGRRYSAAPGLAGLDTTGARGQIIDGKGIAAGLRKEMKVRAPSGVGMQVGSTQRVRNRNESRRCVGDGGKHATRVTAQ